MNTKTYVVNVTRSESTDIVVSCPADWSEGQIREAVEQALHSEDIDDLDYDRFPDFFASVRGASDDSPWFLLDENGAHDPPPPPIGSPVFGLSFLGHKWATNGYVVLREGGPCPDPATPADTDWWQWRTDMDVDALDRLAIDLDAAVQAEPTGRSDDAGHPIFSGGDLRVCLNQKFLAVLCPDLSNLRVAKYSKGCFGVVYRDGEPVALILGRRL